MRGPRVLRELAGCNTFLPTVRCCSKCLGFACISNKEMGAVCAAPFSIWLVLLRRQFLGLTLSPHQLESAFGFFISSRDLFLYLRCSLFHFWREAHVPVILHASSGRNQAADDDVLLEPAQVIHLALNRSFGEHARGLLERRCGDERLGCQRRLGDAEQ